MRHKDGEELGSPRPSSLRPSILLAGAVTLGVLLLATAPPAGAGGLAPDPPPAADVRPDAYPAVQSPAASPQPAQVVVTPAPASVTPASPAPVHVHRTKAAPHHRSVVHRQRPAHHAPKPHRPFRFPTLATQWLSQAATPVAGAGQDVPTRIALVLAALVLASAGLVAAAAREAAR